MFHERDMTLHEKSDFLKYLQPKLNADGSCPIFKENGDIYDLRKWHKDADETLLVKFVKHLYQICHKTERETNLAWFGIYLLKKKKTLVKYAYIGEFSKAEFPVDEENAKKSNNAFVAYYNKDIYIPDVENHTGVYYACDAKVMSELCLPLVHPKTKKVIGIIDCEDFRKNYFTHRLEYFNKLALEISLYLAEHPIYIK
jgi:L-methionine (R)-S-oxide reductase